MAIRTNHDTQSKSEMKPPVLHIRTKDELTKVINWVYSQGGYWGSKSKSAFNAFDSISSVMAFDGVDIYVSNNQFQLYHISHPCGVCHPQLTHVNSLIHLKSYLNNMKKIEMPF